MGLAKTPIISRFRDRFRYPKINQETAGDSVFNMPVAEPSIPCAWRWIELGKTATILRRRQLPRLFL
jgi:hypothetical protein